MRLSKTLAAVFFICWFSKALSGNDADSVTSVIDRYVGAELELKGLKPSGEATAEVLLRRLYFDITGLPPSESDRQVFLSRFETRSLEATLATTVDELLQSPAYAERWGRHWLDVARYGESSGKEANITFPHAWRYRDYVIEAFRNDVPFDRFIEEQLAGDLLPAEDDRERARLLIATGFLAIGTKNLDEGNPMQFAADLVDEQIDTVSRAFMASSIACARCHDHKSDPYSMQDYYALAGIFGSTRTFFGTAVSPANRMAGDPLRLPEVDGQKIFHPPIDAKRVQKLKSQLSDLKKEHDEGMAAAQKAMASGKNTEETFSLRDALRIFWTTGSIEGELEKYDDDGRPLPLAMGVADREKPIDAALLDAGDIGQPGEPVSRRFPESIEVDSSITIPDDQSGRLQLAKWLTLPQHPLTARVIANRIWLHLMGQGLVRTVDDFGATGEPPTHPELLDHLASKMIEGNWSIKKLIRYIVMTRTYRQASTFDTKAYRIDPDNRTYWRANQRRLEAEAVRDAMLAVSGDLERVPRVGSLVAEVIGDRPVSLIGLDPKVPSDLDGSKHRSIYLPIMRDRLPDALAIFDFAEPSLVTGKREVTNVPTQALYLMNSPFVIERAESLARLVDDRFGDLTPAAVTWLHERCFGRSPDDREVQLALRFRAHSDDKDTTITRYCQALLASAEFRILD